MNDTHSALEPSEETLLLSVEDQRQKVRASLGGAARLSTALKSLRAQDPELLFLHAGDAVQGTLYYNVFEGAAEAEFLNLLGLDAMALGNHEFDKGPEVLARMLAALRAPVLSANADVSAEPALAGKLRPYALYTRAGRTIAVIGATTPATPLMTGGAGRVRFSDPAAVVGPLAAKLRKQGADVVILLSHNGYAQDVDLAKHVPGIDLIVGGHSHSLLGPREGLAALGLTPAGPYPTAVRAPDGRTTLVVQAWKWGEILGHITLRFGPDGRLAGWEGAPKLLATGRLRWDLGEISPDLPAYGELARAMRASGVVAFGPEAPETLARLAPYAARVAALRDAPVGARLAVDLVRGTATDPGPLVADSYLSAVPGARISLVGAGGLRRDLPAGEATLGQVMGLLPFGNTLVLLDISGAELKQALEEAVEFRLSKRPAQGGDMAKLPLMHPGGFSYTIRPHAPFGQRIAELRLAGTGNVAGTPVALIEPGARYRLVTNSFLAGGGDGLAALKAALARSEAMDTGVLEHDALAMRLRALGVVSAPAEPPRVRLELAPQGAKNATGLGAGPVSFLPRRPGLAPAA